MFKAKNIGTDSDEMHAILTPSTKGIRRALNDGDVNFTMPLSQINNQGNTSEDATGSINEIYEINRNFLQFKFTANFF